MWFAEIRELFCDWLGGVCLYLQLHIEVETEARRWTTRSWGRAIPEAGICFQDLKE